VPDSGIKKLLLLVNCVQGRQGIEWDAAAGISWTVILFDGAAGIIKGTEGQPSPIDVGGMWQL
jgi:hypothetical protein